MLIRSQDKKMIINTDNLDAICIGNKNAISAYSGDISTRSTIAIYSTEEKAIKVLDMIQDACAKYESVKALSNGTMFEIAGKCNQEKAEDFKNEHRATFVFQMPQDSEV